MIEPSDYPAARAWAVPEAADLQQFPALAAARTWSCAVLGRLRAALVDLGRHFAEVATVAVSGSLGRLEAGPHSDADLIVVLHTAMPAERCAALMHFLWDALARIGLPRPGPTGIYAMPATAADLCSTTTVGRIEEDLPTFGKRIQLLLDAQPVYGFGACTEIQTEIVRRYLTGLVQKDSPEALDYLLNDLQRYGRSLRIRNQWNFSTAKGGWYTRSLKQEHSRVVLYAGLLLLLGQCSKQPSDQEGWLLARLPLTPLERIAVAYVANGDPHFYRIAAAYDRFLAGLNDPEMRASLAIEPPTLPADLQRAAPALYGELQANAHQLQRELVRFVLARQADWSETFFVRMLF